MDYPSESVIRTHTLVPSENNEFYCSVCTDKTSFPSWQEHIANDSHVLTLKQFDSTFDRLEEKVRCKLCDKYYDRRSIRKHGKSHFVLPWHEPDNKYRRFFENGIIRLNKKFYCCQCDCVFLDWFVAHCHIDDATHSESKRPAGRLGRLSDSIPAGVTHKSLVSKGLIAYDDTRLKCKFCNNDRIDFVKITEHVKGFSHSFNRSKFASKVSKKINKESTVASVSTKQGESSQRCCFEEINDKHLPRKARNISIPAKKKKIKIHPVARTHAGSSKNNGSDDISSREGNIRYGECCDFSIPDIEHLHISALSTNAILSTTNVKTFSTKDTQASRSLTSDTVEKTKPCIYIVELNSTESYCKICNTKLSDRKSINNHIAGIDHASALTKYGCHEISPTTGTIYHCKCCDCRIFGKENVYLHIKGERHSSSLMVIRRHRQRLTATNNFSKTAESGRSKLPSTLSHVAYDFAKSSKITELKIGKRRKIVRHRENRFVSVKLPCFFCSLVAGSGDELHSHMAGHVASEFAILCHQKNSKNTDSNDSANIKTELKNHVESNDETLKNFVRHNFPSDPKFIFDNGINIVDDAKSANSRPSNSRGAREINHKIKNRPISKLPKKLRRKKKSTNRIIADQSNFSEDHIYEMKEKLHDIELGMRLCVIVDPTTIYCLICRKNVEKNFQNYFEHLRDLDHMDYFEEMEKDHDLFDVAREQFSELDLARQYVEEISDESVRCLVCKKNFINDDEAIRNHVDSHDHEKFRDATHANAEKNFELVKSRIQCDWYKVEKYWCVPCSEFFFNEIHFANHLNTQTHSIVVEESNFNENDKMIYDFCESCALLWYGYRCTQAYHCDSSSHKLLVRDGYDSLTIFSESATKLLATIDEFVDNKRIDLDDVGTKERERELAVTNDLENSVRSKFSKPRAYAYGSRSLGLDYSDTDIDIFLDCGNMYDGNVALKHGVLNLMTDVHKCLSENSESWKVNEILTACRYPVIRATHIPTGLVCNITITSGLPVENTKLIKSFIDVFPPCRNLLLFLRQWLISCGFSETERISNYALYWYVIFYLQKESIYPSIATLIDMKKKTRVIAGWEVGVDHKFTYNDNHANYTLKKYLIGFFTFYANFDFRHSVACPLIGETLEKRDFALHRKLPKEMARYMAYMEKTDNPEPFNIDCAMCIQDPYDLRRNITETVGKVFLCRFRNYCSKSLDVLCSS